MRLPELQALSRAAGSRQRHGASHREGNSGGWVNTRTRLRSGIRWMAAAAGLAVGAYAAYVSVAWCRYGRAARVSTPDDADPVLDQFMPAYDVRERHQITVAAPAATTLAAAREMDLLGSPVVRAIIKARELILGATPARARPQGLLAEAQALGWGILVDIPDREVVVGAVTPPWKANVVFRALPPAEFVAFGEPGYVKIAWTLRADAVGPDEALFSTETRVVSTDASARARFRTYWSLLSPGVILIRWASLGPLEAEAQHRARSGQIVRSSAATHQTHS
jgi:hypothetical protein